MRAQRKSKVIGPCLCLSLQKAAARQDFNVQPLQYHATNVSSLNPDSATLLHVGHELLDYS